MKMTLTNVTRAGGFLQSEANFARSRDRVTIEGGSPGAGKLAAGTVLGKISASGKYVASPDTGGDGSQTAVAILWDAVDATDADVIATVIARDAEVRGEDLSYDSSVGTDPTKIATKSTQLALQNIIVRTQGGVQADS
jgi:head decoration protein D